MAKINLAEEFILLLDVAFRDTFITLMTTRKGVIKRRFKNLSAGKRLKQVRQMIHRYFRISIHLIGNDFQLLKSG